MNKAFSVLLMVFLIIICFLYAVMNRYEVQPFLAGNVTRYDRWTGHLEVVNVFSEGIEEDIHKVDWVKRKY